MTLSREVEEQLDSAEVWQREASLISNRPRARPPPQFVPATLPYDYWIHTNHANFSHPNNSSNNSFGDSLSGWYRSLTNNTIAAQDTMIKASPTLQSPSSQKSIASISAPKPSLHQNKNNWFIMKAIQSEPSSSVSTPVPTLADILARDPPPLPSEGKYTPPVWLEIGPSNKGFRMLQRSGWNEGEPLGPNIPRRKPVEDILPDDEIIPTKSNDKGKGRPKFTSSSYQRTVKVKMENFDEISESRNINVIDLTLSDSDSDDSTIKTEDARLEDQDGFTDGIIDISASHGGTALLTPIATILKSDRLGIGLKAKTAGLYKASQKRVTHNAAALAAHIRASEENRRHMKEHGRGRRGYEKQKRMEEEKRRAMLAFLKS